MIFATKARCLLVWLRLGDQRPAIAVCRGDETSGHIGAEKRDARGVPAIAHRQRAAGAGGIRLIGERRVRAEGDEVEAMPGKGVPCSTLKPRNEKAALGTAGAFVNLRAVPLLPRLRRLPRTPSTTCRKLP